MSHPTDNLTPVSAHDVRSVRFPLVRRGGYDPRQIDPFLETVVGRLEGGEATDPPLDAAAVHNARFATVRRGGYAPAEVDAFLDRVIDALDPSHAPHGGAWPTDDATSSLQKSVSSTEVNAAWGTNHGAEIVDDAPAGVNLVDLPHLESETIGVGATQNAGLVDPRIGAAPPPAGSGSKRRSWRQL